MRVTGVMGPGLPWVLAVMMMWGPVTSHWNPRIAACPGEGGCTKYSTRDKDSNQDPCVLSGVRQEHLGGNKAC